MLINPEIATLQDERKIPKRGMGNEKGCFDAIEIVFQDI